MTLDQAKARLAERGWALETVGWHGIMDGNHHLATLYLVLRDAPPYVVATGLTYQEAYANATGEAPY